MTATLASPRSNYGSYQEMLDGLEANGWHDGLPVAPATEEVVAEFVARSGRSATDVVGIIPPSWGEATVEKVAINAVMAGCRPEYMPVVLAALEAMLEERFNLFGLQATTAPHAPLVFVSGPIADEIGMNAGAGAFGPGYRANATIGRAVRLVMLNVGGARPGIGDRSTGGQPAKYTYCVAENEAESPWEPYRITLGFGLEQSAVVVAALENPHNINDHASYRAEELLLTVSSVIAGGGSNAIYLGTTEQFLFLCPEHAQLIAGEGFTRRDVQEFVFQHARFPTDRIGAGQLAHLRNHHERLPYYRSLGLDVKDLAEIPVLASPDDLAVVVVGGPGKHSLFGPPSGELSRPTWRAVSH